jgi:hypothetical protein
MPPSQDWGEWKLISEEKLSALVLKWYSRGGEAKSAAKDLVFVSARPGKAEDVVESQRAALFLLRMQCQGASFNAPVPRVEADSSIAYLQTYCDSHDEYKSGVVSFHKTIYAEGAIATIIRIWKVPVGQARTTSSSNAEEMVALLKERGAVDRYMAERIALCKAESDIVNCKR